jgi:sugar phosphate isomerase/epimerase
VRTIGLRRLSVLAAAAKELGVPVLSLCTGSRDSENMWRHHPENLEPSAWADLVATMTTAIAIAAQHDVLLGIEPEPGNVVRTSAHAQRLLSESPSDRLGIVLDPANLLGDDLSPAAVTDAIDLGLELLASRTILAHGKDRAADGTVAAPGQGIVPWDRFLCGLRDSGFDGPLILHGFPVAQAPESAAFVRQYL